MYIGVSRILCRGVLDSLREKRAQIILTTPTTAAFARGGCGLFRRRSETDRAENIFTAYIYSLS